MLNRGDLIGQSWVIMGNLGQGGAGDVYRVKNRFDTTQVAAIKLLTDRSNSDRFLRERYLMERLQHDHVVRLLDMGMHENHPYLVLELIDGGSLDAHLARHGTIDPRTACWILTQVCSGMRAVKTIHRDIKPENLLVRLGRGHEDITFIIGDTDAGACIKIADFGLAKPRASMQMNRLTHDGKIMGTPLYMAPEQCRDSAAVGMEADIYSCGVMLYEMVLGVPPFDHQEVHAIMAAHLYDQPYLPPTLQSPLREIIQTCLEKDPENRYRSWRHFEDALRVVCNLPHSAPSTQNIPSMDPGFRTPEQRAEIAKAETISLSPPPPAPVPLPTTWWSRLRQRFSSPRP